MLVTILFASF